MPRSLDVYSKPAGTTAVPNTTIEGAKYNAFCDDIVADLNLPRPVVAGGTGAATPAAARTNLSINDRLDYYPTVGGTANAITLTGGANVNTSYVTGFRARFIASGSNTTAVTVNVDSLGAKNVVLNDGSATAMTGGEIQSGAMVQIIYDGTRFLIDSLSRLPANATATTKSVGDNTTSVATTAYADAAALSVAKYAPVRQTVLSGPVDSNGYSAFGGSTGSTTVTVAGTLCATAANGFDEFGAVNRVGTVTNPSFTGLSNNGSMYLYLDIAADGTCTPGSTTLAPVYQWGGTYAASNGQFTFNIQEMIGKVGNGSTADQTYRVFVGEVTVSGGVVSAITWYQLMGRFSQKVDGTVSAVTDSVNHKLGLIPRIAEIYLVNTSTNQGYAAGDEVTLVQCRLSGGTLSVSTWKNATAMGYATGSLSFYVANKSTGSNSAISLANWARLHYVADRGW